MKEYKLLGVMISSNLKWEANTEYITKKKFQQALDAKKVCELGKRQGNNISQMTHHPNPATSLRLPGTKNNP